MIIGFVKDYLNNLHPINYLLILTNDYSSLDTKTGDFNSQWFVTLHLQVKVFISVSRKL